MEKRALPNAGKVTMGANLRAARKRASLDQSAAAVASGVGRPLISQWETGVYAPNADGLLRLAIAYRCPLDDFFGGVDERYDDIIEKRIPVDAKQFYAGKLQRLQALTIRAMELTDEAVEAPEPTLRGRAASAPTSRGKSVPTRVHQAPPKRKRAPKKK